MQMAKQRLPFETCERDCPFVFSACQPTGAEDAKVGGLTRQIKPTFKISWTVCKNENKWRAQGPKIARPMSP